MKEFGKMNFDFRGMVAGREVPAVRALAHGLQQPPSHLAAARAPKRFTPNHFSHLPIYLFSVDPSATPCTDHLSFPFDASALSRALTVLSRARSGRRYSLFIPVYPVGAAAEVVLLVLALPEARKGLYAVRM